MTASSASSNRHHAPNSTGHLVVGSGSSCQALRIPPITLQALRSANWLKMLAQSIRSAVVPSNAQGAIGVMLNAVRGLTTTGAAEQGKLSWTGADFRLRAIQCQQARVC